LAAKNFRSPPWAWGDRRYWDYGRSYREEEVHAAFETSLAGGINFFDTAEIYGFGQHVKYSLLDRSAEEDGLLYAEIWV